MKDQIVNTADLLKSRQALRKESLRKSALIQIKEALTDVKNNFQLRTFIF